jgi:hypothetical protein
MLWSAISYQCGSPMVPMEGMVIIIELVLAQFDSTSTSSALAVLSYIFLCIQNQGATPSSDGVGWSPTVGTSTSF